MKFISEQDNSNFYIRFDCFEKAFGKWHSEIFRLNIAHNTYKHYYGFRSLYTALVIFGIIIFRFEFKLYSISKKHRRNFRFKEMESSSNIITFSQTPVKGLFALQYIESDKKKSKLIYKDTGLKISDNQALIISDKGKMKLENLSSETIVAYYPESKSLKIKMK